MDKLKSIITGQRGEIATILTLLSAGMMLMGIIAGTQLSNGRSNIQSKAAGAPAGTLSPECEQMRSTCPNQEKWFCGFLQGSDSYCDCADQNARDLFTGTWCDPDARWRYQTAGNDVNPCDGKVSKQKTSTGSCADPVTPPPTQRCTADGNDDNGNSNQWECSYYLDNGDTHRGCANKDTRNMFIVQWCDPEKRWQWEDAGKTGKCGGEESVDKIKYPDCRPPTPTPLPASPTPAVSSVPVNPSITPGGPTLTPNPNQPACYDKTCNQYQGLSDSNSCTPACDTGKTCCVKAPNPCGYSLESIEEKSGSEGGGNNCQIKVKMNGITGGIYIGCMADTGSGYQGCAYKANNSSTNPDDPTFFFQCPGSNFKNLKGYKDGACQSIDPNPYVYKSLPPGPTVPPNNPKGKVTDVCTGKRPECLKWGENGGKTSGGGPYCCDLCGPTQYNEWSKGNCYQPTTEGQNKSCGQKSTTYNMDMGIGFPLRCLLDSSDKDSSDASRKDGTWKWTNVNPNGECVDVCPAPGPGTPYPSPPVQWPSGSPTPSGGPTPSGASATPSPTKVIPTGISVNCDIAFNNMRITSASISKNGNGNLDIILNGNFPSINSCATRQRSFVWVAEKDTNKEFKDYNLGSGITSLSESRISLNPIYTYSDKTWKAWVYYCNGSTNNGICPGSLGNWSVKTFDFETKSSALPTSMPTLSPYPPTPTRLPTGPIVPTKTPVPAAPTVAPSSTPVPTIVKKQIKFWHNNESNKIFFDQNIRGRVYIQKLQNINNKYLSDGNSNSYDLNHMYYGYKGYETHQNSKIPFHQNNLYMIIPQVKYTNLDTGKTCLLTMQNVFWEIKANAGDTIELTQKPDPSKDCLTNDFQEPQFPQKLTGSSNADIKSVMDLYLNRKLRAKDVSEFISQLTRVSGLQKQNWLLCDPSQDNCPSDLNV